MEPFIKTKIVVTLGPSTDGPEAIGRLIEAGADVFRINTSHGVAEDHLMRLKTVREVALEKGRPIAILLDLQGPKIRLGELPEALMLDQDIIYRFSTVAEPVPETIPVDYSHFLRVLNTGDIFYINDGRVKIRVQSIHDRVMEGLVLEGGPVSSRKGINLPGIVSQIESMTSRDRDYLRFAQEHEVDYIALSFVRSGQDVRDVKEEMRRNGVVLPVIAKIEKPQAVESIDDILNVSDGIMVARGDLGIELSSEKVPLVQKALIRKANARNKPVIVATQMLESMINEAIPTRAETTDVANAVLDGTDAVMLSGETAVGRHPAKVVSMMNRIAENVELDPDFKSHFYERASRENSSLKSTDEKLITRAFEDLELKALISFALEDGKTALHLSKARLSAPVIALTNKRPLFQRLSLIWGVYPYLMEEKLSLDDRFIQQTLQRLMSEGILKSGDKVLFVSGLPYFRAGRNTVLRYEVCP